jgi:uncharacterized protein (DUF2147 family)
MTRNAIALAIGFSALSAMAQMTPIGLWQTISDADGKPQAEVRISESGGVLVGTVERSLSAVANPEVNCEKCTDDRKGKPKIGLQILRGLKKVDGKEVWEGGTVVDPESGTIYKAKVTPIDGGAKLEMRGFVGFSLLGRTQTWIRVQ